MYAVTLLPPEDSKEGIAGLRCKERLKIASWAVEELL